MRYVEFNLKFIAQVPEDSDTHNQAQLDKQIPTNLAWEVNDLVGGAFGDELRGDNEPTDLRVLTPEEVAKHESDGFDDREEPFDD